MIEIVSTSKWSKEQMSSYWDDICRAVQKYVDRFLADITVDLLMRQIFSGERELWVILDDGKFLAFILTEEIETFDKKNRLIISGMGGKITDYLPQAMEYLEQYAREQKIDVIQIMGRVGWKKMLKSHGYRIAMMDYRKDVCDGRV